jgi:hypothetical protein
MRTMILIAHMKMLAKQVQIKIENRAPFAQVSSFSDFRSLTLA